MTMTFMALVCSSGLHAWDGLRLDQAQGLEPPPAAQLVRPPTFYKEGHSATLSCYSSPPQPASDFKPTKHSIPVHSPCVSFSLFCPCSLPLSMLSSRPNLQTWPPSLQNSTPTSQSCTKRWRAFLIVLPLKTNARPLRPISVKLLQAWTHFPASYGFPKARYMTLVSTSTSIHTSYSSRPETIPKMLHSSFIWQVGRAKARLSLPWVVRRDRAM